MIRKILALIFIMTFFSSCSYIIPQSGPSTSTIMLSELTDENLTVIQLNPAFASLLNQSKENISEKINLFKTERYSPVIDKGDVLQVVIYESPPPVLFAESSTLTSGGVYAFNVPPQIVDDKGCITVPFIGRVYVKGKRIDEIINDIEENLKGKANNPQAVVQIVDFGSSYVTVFGNVAQSKKISLTYTNSTLLDILASAGGVTSPINKTIIQIDRGGRKLSIPLEDIIKNPELNTNVRPGDIITVAFKTQSATFLGASGKNDELEFEAKGINLSQGLGRAGGLQDDRAHAKGLFVFRFEDRDILEKAGIKPRGVAQDGKVPIIYNIDMTDTVSIFTLKNFYLKDGDIIYVATAPLIQYQKFLQMINATISPIFMIERMGK